MASSYEGEREDDGPGRCWDLPFEGKDAAREDNHRRKHEKTDQERQPEPAQDSRDLDEKVRPLDFLFRRTPRDVIREEMREQRLGQVD